MRSPIRRAAIAILAVALGLPGLVPGHAAAADKLRVVATTTDLKALTEAVGGNLVDVDSLARGNQNPHDLEVRPSLMVKVRRADLLVINGLELDQWAEVVVQGANNPKVLPGAPGRVDASEGLPVLEVPTAKVDRSMGDIHPVGNPHYTADPGMAAQITANILNGLVRLQPQSRPAFEKNRAAFLAALEQAMGRWTATLAPFKGAKVVQYHAVFVYLLTRFGLVKGGAIEDRPGIPATPGHLARLIQEMKQEQIKLVVVEPWNDVKLAERVAQEAGAKVRVLAPSVGAVKEATSYLDTVDYNVRALADGLR
ncbi:MAG TPA: metal ABC transporter substrate-binding protein [Methylomirabilota bacterium]|jgi:ABC-type Zn uptake system ZnuABC Zn-binding protein ZnuA|nr:metal ABC transporter substrate-binding protein [Methylomirabilota bacterium]